MKSTVGKPRKVTDAQIVTILAWHEAIQKFEAQRKALKTLRELCKELGLAKGTIHRVIRQHGQLKQSTPELRKLELQARRQLIRSIRKRRKTR
jgi:hypothetical protein